LRAAWASPSGAFLEALPDEGGAWDGGAFTAKKRRRDEGMREKTEI
jgi:hypothetical protein